MMENPLMLQTCYGRGMNVLKVAKITLLESRRLVLLLLVDKYIEVFIFFILNFQKDIMTYSSR